MKSYLIGGKSYVGSWTWLSAFLSFLCELGHIMSLLFLLMCSSEKKGSWSVWFLRFLPFPSSHLLLPFSLLLSFSSFFLSLSCYQLKLFLVIITEYSIPLTNQLLPLNTIAFLECNHILYYDAYFIYIILFFVLYYFKL